MTAMRYDPARPVDAEEWSQLVEGEQIELVVEYHRQARIRIPNLRLHAGLHVTVENQVLLGDETPVAATIERLIGEGLDRHDAIHAIASVLSGDVRRSNGKGRWRSQGLLLQRGRPVDRRRLAVASRLNVT